MAELPAQIEVAATQASVELPFTVSITGHGKSFIGDVSIEGDAGTVVLGGSELPLVTYEHQRWSEFGYDLYQGFAVAEDRWYALWFYCEGEQLSYIYAEGTDGTPMDYELASGKCLASDAPTSPEVSFPAVSMPKPPIVKGFTVKGPKIEIADGAPGHMELGDTDWSLLPFETVDCSKDCGSPGWYELHSILWDPTTHRAGFVIVYLLEGQSEVLATYAITLPDLADPVGSTSFETTEITH